VEWGDVYLVPRRDGKVLVGATVEFVGYDKRTTAEGVAMLLRAALQAVPSLTQAHFVTAWAGLRPYAERPLIGQLAGSANAFMATGHFRIGIQLAPATALVIRDFLLTGQSDWFNPMA
jgi:glycine oxidase